MGACRIRGGHCNGQRARFLMLCIKGVSVTKEVNLNAPTVHWHTHNSRLWLCTEVGLRCRRRHAVLNRQVHSPRPQLKQHPARSKTTPALKRAGRAASSQPEAAPHRTQAVAPRNPGTPDSRLVPAVAARHTEPAGNPGTPPVADNRGSRQEPVAGDSQDRQLAGNRSNRRRALRTAAVAAAGSRREPAGTRRAAADSRRVLLVAVRHSPLAAVARRSLPAAAAGSQPAAVRLRAPLPAAATAAVPQAAAPPPVAVR